MIKPFKVQIRFADIDSMGHVNNATYLSYFESARMHFLNNVLGEDWDWFANGIILLKNEVEYRIPLRLRDNALVEVEITHIGNKSFSMSYDLKVGERSYCFGVSHLVAYNYNRSESQIIPDNMRKLLSGAKQE